MARTARKKSESGYYHIVLRGINKQDIFYDDQDREVFLSRLKLVKEQSDYKLLAFCLMGNHVHLLIKEGKEAIGKIMRRILSGYVYWYNSKYERIGNLFQDRFKSESIEDDAYLLCCVRYILQNPLKANLYGDIWKCKWSSAGLLLEEKSSFVDAELIKKMLPNKKDLKKFMEGHEEYQFIEWVPKLRLTDEKLSGKIAEILKSRNIESIYDLLKISKEEKKGILKTIMNIDGATALQVSRLTGISYSFVKNST